MEGQECNVAQQLEGHFYIVFVICISENLTEAPPVCYTVWVAVLKKGLSAIAVLHWRTVISTS